MSILQTCGWYCLGVGCEITLSRRCLSLQTCGWYCLGVGCEITLSRITCLSLQTCGWYCLGVGCEITLCRRPVYPYRPVGGIVWVLGVRLPCVEINLT